MENALKGYRTVLTNLLALAAVLVPFFAEIEALVGYFTLENVVVVAILVAINIGLRYMTDTPIFSSETKEETKK